MNNWLGFSLTPHEQQQQQQHQDQNAVVSRLGFNNSDELSGECTFDLTSTTPSPLNNPFGILEAFNRNNPSHDWNMKGFDCNYKSSENSMLMADGHHQNQQDDQPKLENFLGGHSFQDQEQKLHGCTAVYDTTTTATEGGDYMFHHPHSNTNDHARGSNTDNNNNNNGDINNNNNTSSSSIGLSMIKTWLRNQPPPSQPPTVVEAKNGGGGGSAQSLSLSMGTGSALPLLNASSDSNNNNNNNNNIQQQQQQQQKTTPPPPTTTAVVAVDSQNGAIEAVPRKSIDTFGQRTSIYRGVTRHRWTGRYEAHLWDNSCRREGQTRKGRQVYLGGYDKEEKAARAYDLAALKYWGNTTTTNFPISNYEKEIEEMKHMTRQEYVASLRRKSSGFSRGASIYRGVTRHHQHGRWQARIGRVAGNKDLYLGTFSTQEEAAEAYDIAAIKFRGLNAVTNFDMSRYDVKSILESSTLPIGGAAKRLKDVDTPSEILMPIDNFNGPRSIITSTTATQDHEDDNISSQLTTVDGINSYHNGNGWPTNLPFQHLSSPAAIHHHNQNLMAMQYHNHHHHPYGNGQRVWCKKEQDSSDQHQLLQLGNMNTHNFFQQPSSVLHNLMNIETTASSLQEHSSAGSNNFVYSGGDHGNGGYVIPMATATTVIGGSGNDHQNMFSSSSSTSSDPYHHHNQRWSSSSSVMKASAYDNTWVPTAIPTTTTHGAPPFTVWNDT